MMEIVKSDLSVAHNKLSSNRIEFQVKGLAHQITSDGHFYIQLGGCCKFPSFVVTSSVID